MVYILGASSLGTLSHGKDTPNHIKAIIQKRFGKNFQGTPGLSFNPNTTNKRKTVQYLFSHGLRNTKNIVIWHDLLNNSITGHSSNNYTSLSLHELKVILCRYQEKISALVVCQREFGGQRTPDLQKTLQETGILTLSVTRDLISKRKAKNPVLKEEYLALHQHWELEFNSVSIIKRYSYNLSRLQTKKKRCLSARRKRILRKRQAALNQSA